MRTRRGLTSRAVAWVDGLRQRRSREWATEKSGWLHLGVLTQSTPGDTDVVTADTPVTDKVGGSTTEDCFWPSAAARREPRLRHRGQCPSRPTLTYQRRLRRKEARYVKVHCGRAYVTRDYDLRYRTVPDHAKNPTFPAYENTILLGNSCLVPSAEM